MTVARYRILWVSFVDLHDTTNGAAIRCRLMLEKLLERGIEVKALTATVAENPQGYGIFSYLEEQLGEKDKTSPYYRFVDNGIEFFVVKTALHDELSLSRRDEYNMMNTFTYLVDRFQPDLIMGYGGDACSCCMRREAHSKGIKVAYALCNGLHHKFGFPECDLIFTTSQATARLYKERDGVSVKAVGNFIEPSRVAAPQHNPQYITLINPALKKGLAVFIKLAQVCAVRHPELKFLVVKSAGNYAQELLKLHYPDGRKLADIADGFKGSIKIDSISNVASVDHTNDVRQIYAVTRVLVAPSLWHESWGRVATEAVFNNIPVLCSQSGGLPEAVAGAGIALEAPPETVKDHSRIPTDEEIEPWVQALERLLNEDWTERCWEAAKVNSIKQSTDRLLNILTPLLKEGRLKKNIKGSWIFTKRAVTERLSGKTSGQ